MSKIGPLTSVFTAPSSCSNSGVYDLESEGWAQEPFRPECFPDGFRPSGSVYYSPASDCPSGYTIACETSIVAGDVTDTVRTCCPDQRSYICQTRKDYAWQITRGCESGLGDSFWTLSPVTKISGGLTTTTSASGNGGAVNAFSIQIRFPGKTQTTATSSEGSASASSRPSASSAPSSPSATDTPKNGQDGSSSGGVSPGAAAGIGVGAGLGAICLVGAIIFMVVRRRRYSRERRQAPAGYLNYSPQQPYYLPANSANPHTSQFLPHELSSEVPEPKTPRTGELPST